MQEASISGIYIIINTVTKNFYIGSSSNARKRKKEHFKALRLNKHPNKRLQGAYNKHGEDSLEMKLIEIVEDLSILIDREQYWIDKLKPKYNIITNLREPYRKTVLEGRKQRKLTDSHKAKISRSNTEYWSSESRKTRKQISEETRQKMSISSKNRKHATRSGWKRKPFSDEHKKKLSEARKKRIFSDETKEKMSKSQSEAAKKRWEKFRAEKVLKQQPKQYD